MTKITTTLVAICTIVFVSLFLAAYYAVPPQPQIRTSDARCVVMQYVDDIDVLYEVHNGMRMTAMQRRELTDRILDDMKSAGVYRFVDK